MIQLWSRNVKMAMSRREAGHINALKSLAIIEQQKQERIRLYNLNPKKCLSCNSNISYERKRNKYCSHRCSASQTNKFRELDRARNECKICGIPVPVKSYKYCSAKCSTAGMWNETKSKIERGEKTSVNSLRKYLDETRERKCEICNGKEWFGNSMPLVMDHIDGNPANDLPSNLRWICPNCDRFLPTFGSRNRGYGRKSRGLRRGCDL